MPGSQERQRRRARERFERQQELKRAHQQKVRKRAWIIVAAVVVIGLAIGLPLGLSGSPSKPAASKPAATASPSPTATSTTATVTEPATHCDYSKSSGGSVKSVGLPPSTPDYKSAFTATINTSLGPIGINLLNSKATCTVNSFAHLASANLWNNTQCHRLSTTSPLYMLQCGDPTVAATQKLSCSDTSLGEGGPGYEFASENLKGATYPAGTVAMANSGTADSNGSQFFLVFKDTQLPPSYTPFGTITSGLDILQNVAKAGTSCTFPGAGGGVPKEKVVIKSVAIHKV